MWTAQTYIGAFVAKAEYFMYLLVEDYLTDQEEFSQAVIADLRELGMRTGDASAIFVPDDRAREHIRSELREVFTEKLMPQIDGETPGILFTDKNLCELDPGRDRWVFLSLRPFMNRTSSKSLPQLFTRMQTAIRESGDLLSDMTGPGWKRFWDELKNLFMFEPNFCGIGMRDDRGASQVVISGNLD